MILDHDYSHLATESVLSAMISSNVQYLIFLSDAYANLEVEDNFGLSEDNYSGIPTSFITGEAGETRIRAELVARSFVGKKLNNGKDLRAVFPRPVFLYGEGDRKLPLALKTVSKRYNGSVPYLDGASNGMFQYVSFFYFFHSLHCIQKQVLYSRTTNVT